MPDLYFSLIHSWMKNKGVIFLDSDSFDFNSKDGMTYRKEEDNYKRNFEYTIKLRSRDNLRKFYISFKPDISKFFYGRSAKYGDYKPYKPKKGEGVEVEVNGTYYSFEETQELLRKLMIHLGVGKYWEYQNKDKGKIRQCEYYLRYAENKEQEIANKIHEMDKVIGLSDYEETKITRTKEESAYLLYSLRSNRFDELGFSNNKGKWRFAIKTYRVREWQKFDYKDPLHNPKLEIYMDEEKRGKEYPDLKDFYKLKEEMYQIIGNICIWSKISNEDFISDSYFNSENISQYEIKEKKNMIEKLNKLYQSIKPEIRKEASKLDSVRDYLKCLSIYENITYETLKKFTGLGVDWVKKLTYKLEEKNIIKTYRGTNTAHSKFASPTYIIFQNKIIAEVTKAIVDVMDFSFDNKDFEEEREKRKEERTEKRERRKKHVFSRKELTESELKILVENKIIEYRNGGVYELLNYEIIEPPPPVDYENNLGGLNGG